MSPNTECLIIGTGIAGLSAAISLAKEGRHVQLISAATEPFDSNSAYAQGGIIYQSLQGDPESLIQDIMDAGCYLNYRPAVEQLARMGPALVKDVLVDKIGVPFDRENGTLRLTREGAHSQNRILHTGDETGKSIEEKLLEYCKNFPSIQILTEMTAVNLLMTSFHSNDASVRHERSRCFGAFVFNQKTQEVIPIIATHTVLATGGLGQLFAHNTNQKHARGDGIALAYRAGCRLENLEYVQFHPTTFFHPDSRRFLITEAIRGEGGVLINRQGKRFLNNHLKGYEIPELAPRDKVAQAIHREMLNTGESHVYLDISHKESQWLSERFPFVYRNCLQFGIDISKEPIPVVPAAHYHCGGVWSDLEGKTSVGHLWAVGEVASTGVHGANRLASTSLLEGLVWGTRGGQAVARELQSDRTITFPSIAPWNQEHAKVDPAFLKQDWMTLKETMWNYVGLIKTNARLERAEGILNELSRGINTFYRKAVLSDELVGLRHAALVARLIVDASKRNNKSVGCYLREELEI